MALARTLSKKDIEVEVADGVLTIRSVKEKVKKMSGICIEVSHTESSIESLHLQMTLLSKMQNYKMVF